MTRTEKVVRIGASAVAMLIVMFLWDILAAGLGVWLGSVTGIPATFLSFVFGMPGGVVALVLSSVVWDKLS